MNKYYFINKFDTNIIDKQDKQTTIIYRNYTNKKVNKLLLLKLKKYCKKKGKKPFLSNNIKLAIKLLSKIETIQILSSDDNFINFTSENKIKY